MIKVYKVDEETGEVECAECETDQRKLMIEAGWTTTDPNFTSQEPEAEGEGEPQKKMTAKEKLAAEKEEKRRAALTQEEREAEDAAKKGEE